MKYGIKLIELVGEYTGGVSSDAPVTAGAWLKSYDPEAYGGRGYATWTLRRADAMEFDSIEEAVTLYRLTSETRPLRNDGEPNRPLTAFTVEIAPLAL